MVKKLKLKMILFAVFVLSTIPALNASAAEKKLEIKLKNDYSKCVFDFNFEKSGNYEIEIISPDGNVYKGLMKGDKGASCSVSDAEAGTWIADISNEDVEEVEELGKVTISASVTSDEGESLDEEINASKDIAGLKMYLTDRKLTVEWTDNTVGDVDITVYDLSTKEILDSERVTEFSYEKEIPDGIKDIMVEIKPSVSGEVSKQYSINMVNDKDAMVSYEDVDYSNKPTEKVNVTLNKEYFLKLMVGDTCIKQTETLDTGDYEYEIPLNEGENHISVIVCDEKDNGKSYSTDITKDTICPVLALNDLQDNVETYDDTIKISGNVKDFSLFKINDVEYEIANNGNFEIDYSLLNGTNSISISAIDEAGNVATYDMSVIKLVKNPKAEFIKVILKILTVIIPLIFIVIAILLFKNKKNRKGKMPVKKERPALRTKEKTPLNKNKEIKHQKKNEIDKKTNFVKSFVFYGIVFLGCYIFFNTVLFGGYIASSSMEPTFQVGKTSHYLGNGLSYVFKNPKRGDVVVFKVKEFGNDRIIKRVIGIPGDQIEFHDGFLYINGEKCIEDYIAEDSESNSNETFTVPDNCYFVMGDNREMSEDSRYMQNPYIRKADIKGKVIAKFYFPL